ncbi:MAG: hypothetical protein ACOYMA_16040 [Bacteroidia bacterium]
MEKPPKTDNKIQKIEFKILLQSIEFWLYFLCFAIISLSFYYFSGLNSVSFNSDQAVQVLMIKDFQWPSDAYYWGQNRLGSLLPLISYILYAFLKIHPIILVSIVNYAMLLIGWIIFSKFLKSNWAKLLFCIAIFLPHPAYFFIILIGHPYQGQFFTLALSTLFFNNLYSKIASFEKWNFKDYLKLISTIFTSLLAVWVSELSLVFYAFILFYILFSNEIRKAIFSISVFKSNLLMPIITSISLLLLGFFLLIDLKHNFESDPVYDLIFIDSFEKISLQFHYFYSQLIDVLLLQNHHTVFECLFYYAVIFSIIVVVFNFKKIDKTNQQIFKSLGLTFVVAVVLLFFSSWNFRSKYDPKYYTLLYALFYVFIGVGFNALNQIKQIVLFVMLSTTILYSNFLFLKIYYDEKSVLEQYNSVIDLPKGTLVSDYWKAYKIAAIGFDSLEGVPKDYWNCRNIDKIKKWSKNENFYFIKSELFEFEKHNDTLFFKNMKFIPTNTFYKIDIDTLILYKNLSANFY